MARYKKKPMEVDAFRFLESEPRPTFVEWDNESQHWYVAGDGKGQPFQMPVKYGDWLITGESGNHYGCANEDFLRIWEPV